MAVVNEVVTEFSFKGSTAPLAKYTDILGSAVKGLAGLGAAIVANTAIIYDQVTAVATAGDEYAKFGRQVGLSAESLQEWEFIAGRQGVTTGELNGSFKFLNKNLGELRGGYGTLVASLKKTNPELLAQLQNTKSTEEANLLLLKSINEVESSSEKAALAQAAYGRSGASMTRIAEAGASGIADLSQQFDALGGAGITNIAAAEAEAMLDAQANLALSIGSIRNQILSSFMPAIKSSVESVSSFITENRKQILEFGEKFKDISVSMVGALKRLTPVLLTGAAAWGVMTLATGGFATVMTVVTSPVTIFIAAAVAALLIMDDLIVAFQGGESAIAGFIQEFTGFDIVPVLKGTVDAVMWMVDTTIEGFKQLFDYLAWGWNKYEAIVGSITGAVGSVGDVLTGAGNSVLDFVGLGGDESSTVTNDMTRAGQFGGGVGAAARTNNNKVENTNNITINASNAIEAKTGVDSALQDQLRNTETTLNRIG